jgi:hypothetical protein
VGAFLSAQAESCHFDLVSDIQLWKDIKKYLFSTRGALVRRMGLQLPAHSKR